MMLKIYVYIYLYTSQKRYTIQKVSLHFLKLTYSPALKIQLNKTRLIYIVFKNPTNKQTKKKNNNKKGDRK